MTENMIIKSLGHYKKKIKILNSFIHGSIQKGIWPFTNFVLKQELISLINEIQFTIAHLGSLNKILEALRYVEYFSFSLANRFLCVENIRAKSSWSISGVDETTLKKLHNSTMCFSLVSLTHPKYIKTCSDLEVRSARITKKDSSTSKVLRIYNIVDSVLQLQMAAFMDPLIDAMLPEHFYGSRRGRSSLQAIAYLSSSIRLSDISRYHLVFVSIWKCFNFISHEFVHEKLPFPIKYKNLLARWIRCFRVLKSGKKRRMWSGTSQGSVLGSIICNFTLAHLTSDFFKDLFFSKSITFKNVSGPIRFFICYYNDLVIKVTNPHEGFYALKKLVKKLSKVNLNINSEKTCIYDLSTKIKFDWLGYTFLVIPKSSLRFTKLLGRRRIFTCKIIPKYQTQLLLYITNAHFTFIKKKLKKEIKKLKHKHLFVVLQKINYMLKNISGYYGFVTMRHRLSYLHHFVDKVFWRTLIEKFRCKGVRRSSWVARTFFVTTASPLGLKWHLNFSRFDGNTSNKKSPNTLWCVNVVNLFKLQPMSINILPQKLRINSFYLCRKKYNSHRFKIQERRISYKSTTVLGHLFKRQKGICIYCEEFLDLFDGGGFKIYSSVSLKVYSPKIHTPLFSRKAFFFLLHRGCYTCLCFNLDSAKLKGLLDKSIPT